MHHKNPLQDFLETQKKTNFIRMRKNELYTFGITRLPYIFLAESAVNESDVVVRKGVINVDPPKIVSPCNNIKIQGFGLDDEEENAVPVLLNRWVHFPPAKYHNDHTSLDVVNGSLESATEKTLNKLDQASDIYTGVMCGPEDKWGFSILGYIGQMIVRSARNNIGEYFERRGFDSPDFG